MGEDQIKEIAESVTYAIKSVRDAIAPIATPGTDAAGGHVSCLTEATMGITAGLFAVANSISDLAEAVRSTKSNDD